MTRYIAFFVGLIVLGAVGFLYFSDGEYPIKNYPSGGKNIIAFGDSLVEGAGASVGNDFVSVLSKRLEIPIVNQGIGGDTTKTALSRLDRDVLAWDPKIVIVLLGGNDIVRRVPVEETFQNLNISITKIQEQGAVVILVGIRSSIFGGKYPGLFKNLAGDTGAAYVDDILDGIFGHPNFMFDTIHPNDAGNIIMADRIEPLLRKLLD